MAEKKTFSKTSGLADVNEDILSLTFQSFPQITPLRLSEAHRRGEHSVGWWRIASFFFTYTLRGYMRDVEIE